MNHEEATLVPLFNQHFSDDEIDAMVAAVQAKFPRERLAAYLRWMLRSLNVHELRELFGVLQTKAPAEVLAFATRLAEENVAPTRWALVLEPDRPPEPPLTA
jgi:hypothetical protein